MPTSPIEALETLRPNMSASRVDYLHSVARLPDALREVASDHYQKRVGDCSPRLLFGEYAPWLVAEVLPVTDESVVRDRIDSWLHIYASVLLLDDAIDGRDCGHASSEMTIAAHLLLQRGLCHLLSRLPNDAVLAGRIDDAFARIGEAGIAELRKHRTRLNQYAYEDTPKLGNKMAVLQVCIDAFGEVSGVDPERLSWARQIFHKLCAGMQLLDDITDWEEDYLSGNMTLPLTIAAATEPAIMDNPIVSCRLVRRRVLMALVTSGAVLETLSRANDMLSSAIESLERDDLGSRSVCYEYLKALVEAMDTVAAALTTACAQLARDDNKALAASGGTVNTDDVLSSVETKLKIVAQST